MSAKQASSATRTRKPPAKQMGGKGKARPSADTAAAGTAKSWTVMVYMAGDNSLAPDAWMVEELRRRAGQ